MISPPTSPHRKPNTHIEAVLGQPLTGTPTDPALPSRLTETLQLPREHILKEQNGVFPAALAQPGHR